MSRLIGKELKLAREEEYLKQQLASRYDYSLDFLFKSVDDWNYKYIDQINLKRFLVKCGVIPTDNLLMAIIRRMDLDADAKLNLKEFIDSVRPIENFTKKVMTPLKKSSSTIRPRSSMGVSQGRNSKLQQQNTLQLGNEYSAGVKSQYGAFQSSSPLSAAQPQRSSILKK